jgi:GMP synthase-like glutamine amidotransferase
MFEKDGFEIDTRIVVEGDRIPENLDGYDALIVLGGPAAVYEDHQYLRKEENLIRNSIADDIPSLGICLGSQLIASAAGARVYKGPKKEIGWYPVRITDEGSRSLFNGLKNDIVVFQWHGDTYDLPKNAVSLATTELYPVQAFRVGSAVGIQFHLEISKNMILDWLDQYKTELESVKNYIRTADILAGIDRNLGNLNEYARVLYKNFSKQIQENISRKIAQKS